MKLNNTLTRTIAALLGIPFIIAACYYGNEYFLIFTLIVGIASFYEFSLMASNKKSEVNKPAGIIIAAAIIINSYYGFIDFEILVLIFMPVLLLMELFRNKESAILNLSSALLGIFYIGLFSAAFIKIREFYSPPFYDQGGFLIISVLASIWACDSGAFFIGSALGKHKLFPRVSPKKSWEGAIAGFAFSVLTMIALRSILIDFISLKDAIFIGLIVGIFGQVGDLIESLLKRDASVKDSSSIIPGHGGILDRFDSLLYSAPLVYLYLRFFVQ